MKIPKMIIFDYGHTLVHEEKWNGAAGERAVLEYSVSNKNNLTAEQISCFADKIYSDIANMRMNIEFHQHKFQKLVYEHLQIEIDLSPERLEEIYWDNAAPANAMPYIAETLDFLFDNNIRTGVISNISFSGGALHNRIKKVLPNNNFEFIIASSEYIFRKPEKTIFDIALIKANLKAKDVWYCGDSIDFDVIGASQAGIFPVLYESEIECWYRERGNQCVPDCEYLHIKDWRELIDIIQRNNG
jgi:putative hydrolase of the HAD superfamily